MLFSLAENSNKVYFKIRGLCYLNCLIQTNKLKSIKTTNQATIFVVPVWAVQNLMQWSYPAVASITSSSAGDDSRESWTGADIELGEVSAFSKWTAFSLLKLW